MGGTPGREWGLASSHDALFFIFFHQMVKNKLLWGYITISLTHPILSQPSFSELKKETKKENLAGRKKNMTYRVSSLSSKK